jgi:hypothetical protein
MSHDPSTAVVVGSLSPTFVSDRARLALYSQAPFCLYARWLGFRFQPEGTIGRLRYCLGGDRPSQTAHLARSPTRITESG